MLRSAALRGESGKEAAMIARAEAIAARGLELGNIVGSELRQYERQMELVAKSNGFQA